MHSCISLHPSTCILPSHFPHPHVPLHLIPPIHMYPCILFHPSTCTLVSHYPHSHVSFHHISPIHMYRCILFHPSTCTLVSHFPSPTCEGLPGWGGGSLFPCSLPKLPYVPMFPRSFRMSLYCNFSNFVPLFPKIG